jgi:hypothetical protein
MRNDVEDMVEVYFKVRRSRGSVRTEEKKVEKMEISWRRINSENEWGKK